MKSMHACASLVMLLTVASCYSLPRQSGKWVGSVHVSELYGRDDIPVKVLEFQIESGPKLKELLPNRLVLVDKNDRCFTNGAFGAERLIVRGKIDRAFPNSLHGDKVLQKEKREGNPAVDIMWVLRVASVRELQAN